VGHPAAAVVPASAAVPSPNETVERVHAVAVAPNRSAERAVRRETAAERAALPGTLTAVLAFLPGAGAAAAPVAGTLLSGARERVRRRDRPPTLVSPVTARSAGRVAGRRSVSAVTPPKSSASGRRRPRRSVPCPRRPKIAPRFRRSKSLRRQCLPSGGTVRSPDRGAVRRYRPAIPLRPRRRWCSARYRRESWWKRGYTAVPRRT
jgi:hypothetical protein